MREGWIRTEPWEELRRHEARRLWMRLACAAAAIAAAGVLAAAGGRWLLDVGGWVATPVTAVVLVALAAAGAVGTRHRAAPAAAVVPSRPRRHGEHIWAR